MAEQMLVRIKPYNPKKGHLRKCHIEQRFGMRFKVDAGWYEVPAHVARELGRLGGEPRLRAGFVTDNGNLILDVHGLKIDDPVGTEARINQIVGVVSNGLFAARGADILLLAGADGVQRLQRRDWQQHEKHHQWQWQRQRRQRQRRQRWRRWQLR